MFGGYGSRSASLKTEIKSYIERVMKERKPFSQDRFFYEYYFVSTINANAKSAYNKDKAPFEASFWKTMMKI